MPFPAAVDAAATTEAHGSAPGLPGRDGVYRPRRPEHTLLHRRRPAGDIGFHRAPAPSPTELRWVVDTVRRRVLRRLGRMGLLRDERLAGEGSNESADPSALEACGQLALRAGDLEAHDGGNGRPDDVPFPRRSGRRLAHDAGFDVHAGVRVPAGDDVGRERLARYVTRPPFAAERFTELPDGRIAYEVRHPLGPGKTRRVMTPVELLARLAAIVPPPRYPLLRYFGVLAANSPLLDRAAFSGPLGLLSPRDPRRPHRPGASVGDLRRARCGRHALGSAPARSQDPLPGALATYPGRTPPCPPTSCRLGNAASPDLRVDALSCPRCRGTMSPIAVVTDEAEAGRILAALGLPHQPVAVAPPRDPDEPTSRGPPRADGDADGPDGLFAFDDSAQPFPDDDGNQVVPGDAEI